jgi:hypothetical protein
MRHVLQGSQLRRSLIAILRIGAATFVASFGRADLLAKAKQLSDVDVTTRE